jgi:two-component system KDP operon response regulator KdpE
MPEKILIIRAGPVLMPNIERWLSAQYMVLAEDSKEGWLKRVTTWYPDLIVLGVPHETDAGWSVCHQLRQLAEVPLVVWLDTDDGPVRAKALYLGADDCLSASSNREEVLARIQRLLRRARLAWDKSSPDILRLTDLVIDFAAQRVTIQGRQVELSPKECRLLAYLVKNAGRVVPREELLREVWGPEHAQRYDYLKLYAWYLRRKIEVDPNHPRHLFAKKGVGYRFDTA